MKLALLVVLSLVAGIKSARRAVNLPSSTVYPCPPSKQLTASFITKRTSEEENRYDVTFRISKRVDSEVNIKFDSEATINLEPPLNQAATVTETDQKLNVKFLKETDSIRFRVSGTKNHIIPYITSFNVNGVEYCSKPSTGYFDNFKFGNQNTNGWVEDNDSCGRRKIKQTELSGDGVDPKPDYWPWHVIINRLEGKVYENVCGGTLVSNSWVLTAAHCVLKGEIILNPYFFLITLGYDSFGYSVSDIVVHDDFKITPLKSDIALLKLKSEVIFDDYIQPACVWHDKISEKLSSEDVYGSVGGWVFEGKNETSTKSHNRTMLILSEATCITSNPEFYTTIVDERNFCAGLINDTAAWHGDTGGGFYIFVPDDKSENADNIGAWYVRGILSQSPATDAALSDPQYAVFTDTSKYYQWIQKYI